LKRSDTICAHGIASYNCRYPNNKHATVLNIHQWKAPCYAAKFAV